MRLLATSVKRQHFSIVTWKPSDKKEWKTLWIRQRVPGESLGEFIRIHLEGLWLAFLEWCMRLLTELLVCTKHCVKHSTYRNKLIPTAALPSEDEHPYFYRRGNSGVQRLWALFAQHPTVQGQSPNSNPDTSDSKLCFYSCWLVLSHTVREGDIDWVTAVYQAF